MSTRTSPVGQVIQVRCAAPVTAAVPAESAGSDGASGDRRLISGQIATYGKTINPGGPFPAVRLAAGALTASGPVLLLDCHDASQVTRVLGSLTDGLTTAGDAVGASFRMARTQAADDALCLAQDGHLTGLSGGYLVQDGSWVLADGEEVFEITAADLIEVSLVPFPADGAARVETVTQAQRSTAMTTVVEPADRGELEIGTAPGTIVTAEQVTEAVRAAMKEIAPQAAAPVGTNQPAVTARQEKVGADGWGRFLPGYTAPNGMRITAGDYMSAVMKQRQGDGAALARIQAAIKDEGTAQVPGLLPTPIVQPIIDTLAPIRPVFESLASRVMPANGSTFQRPSITQHVAVGEQAAEFDAVTSQQLTVELDDVTKRTIAGALRLSVQSIDWTTPALLDLVISDFAKVYAVWSEKDISAKFAAAATGTGVELPAAHTAADLNAAFYTATAQSWTESGQGMMPDRAWMSLDVWAMLGGTADESGRPLYPYFGSNVNGQGTLSPAAMLSGEGNVGSYRPVVGPYLPAGTLLIGSSQAEEVYEDRRGMLRVPDPSALGQVIAWYGYVANYTAAPKSLQPITIAAAVQQAVKSGS